MKTILLWDPRLPDAEPRRLTVEDDAAAAAVRAGVAAYADASDNGAASGRAGEPGYTARMARLMMPLSVVALGLAKGTLALGEAVRGSGSGAPAPSPAPTPAPVSAAGKSGQIGFNVEPDNGQGGGTLVWLDRMKSSGSNEQFWGGDRGAVPVSPYGYPTGLGANTQILTFVALRRPAAGQPAIRHVLRTNAAGLRWAWVLTENVRIVDASDPQRVVFDVGPGVNVPQLKITGAATWPDYRPGNPQATRDGIAVYELAHEAAYLAGEVIHPAAVADGERHYALRFMDALKTNSVVARNLGDRTLYGSSSYSANTPWGMPLEAMVAYCNRIKANLWYCLPHAASDAYQDWAFAYIRDNLDPSLYLQLEYSNEVWNSGFGNQYNHAQAYARALNPDWNFNHGYGHLFAKMVRRARQVFGAQAGRVLGMYARQITAAYGFEQGALGAEALEGRKLRDYAAALALGFYGGAGAQNLVLPQSTPQQRQLIMGEVAQWEKTGVVRQALVDEMRVAGTIGGWPVVGSLTQQTASLQEGADFCRAQGIAHFVGYEGQNWHVNADGPLGPADGLRITTMMLALADDPRISGTAAGSFMRDQYAMMRSKGMTGHMIFMDYGRLSQYGLWGTKENVFSAPTPRWTFYRWYQDNRPDPVLFEISVTGGGPTLSLNEPTERVVTTYGGAIPAGPVTLKAGALPPGMSFANGRLSGTPTTTGEFPLTFAATDAGGREVTVTRTYTVATQKNYRYFRVTPKRAGNGAQPGDYYYRVGTGEVNLRNGATALPRTGWTVTSESNTNGNVPAKAIDGDPNSYYLTFDRGAVNGGRFVIDTGAGEGVKPSSVDIGQCLGDFNINGCVIEASRNGADWARVADVPVGAMSYPGGVCNVPLAYPA